MIDFGNFDPLIDGYREAINHGNYSKLAEALRNGNPAILNSIHIRNLLADRIMKLPERGIGEKTGSKGRDERRLQLLLLMGKYIALGFAKNSNSETYKGETAASMTATKMNASQATAVREWNSFQTFKREALKRQLFLLPERRAGIVAEKYSGMVWAAVLLEISSYRAVFIKNNRVKPDPGELDKLVENYRSSSTDHSIWIDANTESEQLLLGKRWLEKLVPDIKNKKKLTNDDKYYIWLANWEQ
jgi:hypothetical protein